MFEIRNVDIWDAAQRVLQNTRRFRNPDIIEKGVLLMFYVVIWVSLGTLWPARYRQKHIILFNIPRNSHAHTLESMFGRLFCTESCWLQCIKLIQLIQDIKNAVDGKETKASISKIKKRRDEFLERVKFIMEHSAANVEQVHLII